MLVSIILPSYNVKRYLESSISSILASGLSSEVYEVLIIDDGSTDGTGLIGKGLNSDYPNIYYYYQANQGVSAARNYGLSLAKNKYIWFIAPEDMVKSELVLDMVYFLVDKDLDALGMNYFEIAEDGALLNTEKECLNGGGKSFLSGGEFYNLNFNQSYIWQYIIRKEIFTGNNISFKEGMNMEDSEIVPKLMAHIYRIGIIENPVYAYRIRKDSLLRMENFESNLHFMKSTIMLAESIKDQQKLFATYKGLAEGLAKKLIQVNQILYLKFIAGHWTIQQRETLVLEMKKKSVFPFSKIRNLSPSVNFRLNAWRFFINLHPVPLSHLYHKINQSDK